MVWAPLIVLGIFEGSKGHEGLASLKEPPVWALFIALGVFKGSKGQAPLIGLGLFERLNGVGASHSAWHL